MKLNTYPDPSAFGFSQIAVRGISSDGPARSRSAGRIVPLCEEEGDPECVDPDRLREDISIEHVTDKHYMRTLNDYM